MRIHRQGEAGMSAMTTFISMTGKLLPIANRATIHNGLNLLWRQGLVEYLHVVDLTGKVVGATCSSTNSKSVRRTTFVGSFLFD